MDIIYAAEKPSIAGVLSRHLRAPVSSDDIDVCDNPEATGSFLVQWSGKRFVLLPDGRVRSPCPLD